MLQLDDLCKRLNDPVTKAKALAEIGEWATNTCLLMGSSVDTAYQVAAFFLRGLERGEQAKPRRPIRKRRDGASHKKG